ncbi:MAG: tetratricopeptide repeat protein [Actinomycetota bacterium]
MTLLSSPALLAADANPAALIHDGHFKQARSLLDRQLRQNPNDADALVLRARIDLAYQKHEGALKLLREAVELEPSNSDAHVYLAEAYGQKIQHAGVFDKLGMARTIRKEAERAVAFDPKNLDALESLMEFHIDAPGIVGGNKGKASELAERITALDPVRGAFARSTIAAHEKRYAEQKRFQLEAVEQNPRSYDALIGAARLYLSDRWLNYRTASEFAARAIAVDPARVRGYSLLAQSYAGLGELDKLAVLLARSEAEVPDDFAPYFYAGQRLLVAGKNPALAEQYLRKYLTQEPEGESPTLGEAHWRLGQALERQGRKTDAVHEIEQAVRMNPDLKEARRDLKRLRS